MSQHTHEIPGATEFKALFYNLLGPEQRFYQLVLVYSIAISLLTLAIPISIQALIDTIANIGLVRAVVMISLILFGLLLVSGALYALRAYILELFNRQIFIRLASEMAMSAVSAREVGTDDRQRLALFNRFFDIMTLKKTVPDILTNGFSLLLQSLIGFIVVSLYHLYFFIFALVLVLLIWVVWKIWGWRAIVSSFMLSEAKYETADWLQNLSMSLRDFKDTGNVEYILDEFDGVVNHHVDLQEKLFAFNFKQLLSLLFINALASAALLGMGGWLVIQGELTLGQLVAAELIMLGIFAGLAPLASYLGYFYDICAAVEEISRLNSLPQEGVRPGVEHDFSDTDLTLEFRKSVFVKPGTNEALQLDFSLRPGEVLRMEAVNPRVRVILKNALAGNIYPRQGEIFFGKLATKEMNAFELRKMIKVLDRATVIPGSIRHYLLFSKPDAMQHEISECLEVTGMQQVIDNLPQGLDTLVGSDGFPLTLEECLGLKLAAIYLARPRVLVLKHMCDLLEAGPVQNVVNKVREYGGAVIYFTQRQDMNCFTREICFDEDDLSVKGSG